MSASSREYGCRAWHRLARRIPLEAVLWAGGLLAMAAMDPRAEHFVGLCPLDALGLSFCPGCGLGHAVAYLARGALVASVQAHPLGIPAVLILCVHVGRLLRHGRCVDARRPRVTSHTSLRHVERHRVPPRTGGG